MSCSRRGTVDQWGERFSGGPVVERTDRAFLLLYDLPLTGEHRLPSFSGG
ncbi:hypothetical protein LH612_27890 [Klebsiella pneumoniae]|jgi:hypothetical protein|nr:hypothetical protein [Klebsiella pneumoniae]